MQDDPYTDFREETVPGNLDTVLVQLADELVEAQKLVEIRERALEEAKEAVSEIAEKRIPNATDGLEGKFTLSDGRTLEVKEDIRSSIAGEKRIPAIQWLDEHDYGHIVKRVISVEFGKNSDEEVAAFKKALEDYRKKTKRPLVVKEQYSVHHATLNAWVKEQLGEGVELPRDTFGIFRQRVAKVKE